MIDVSSHAHDCRCEGCEAEIARDYEHMGLGTPPPQPRHIEDLPEGSICNCRSCNLERRRKAPLPALAIDWDAELRIIDECGL